MDISFALAMRAVYLFSSPDAALVYRILWLRSLHVRAVPSLNLSRIWLIIWQPVVPNYEIQWAFFVKKKTTKFGTNTQLFCSVIVPISTWNDYLNALFDDVISLCRNCRNIGSHGSDGKASTCCSSLLSSLHVISRSLL